MKREQRRIWRGYLEEFKEYLRPKPKHMPWWLWTWMQRKVLHMEKIDAVSVARDKMK
jgi:hypothetical protein